MPIPRGDEVTVLAAPALGSVMPWFVRDLMLATPLAKLERAVSGAVAKWPMFVKVAPFFQFIFNSVEGIHFLGIFLWAQPGGIPFFYPALRRRFTRTLARALGSSTRFDRSVTQLLTNSVMDSLIGELFVTFLSVGGHAALEFSVDTTHRFAYAAEATEMEPLSQTVAVFDCLPENMLATTLAQSHSVTVSSLDYVEHFARQVLERQVECVHILNARRNSRTSLKLGYVYITLVETQPFLELLDQLPAVNFPELVAREFQISANRRLQFFGD
jgi:hypothetical protein